MRALALALTLLPALAFGQVTLDAGFPVGGNDCESGGATATTASYTTGGATRTLIAAVMTNSVGSGGGISTPTGGPATWTAAGSVACTGSISCVAFYYAQVTSTLTGVTTSANYNNGCASIVVWSFASASTPTTPLTTTATADISLTAATTGGYLLTASAYWDATTNPVFRSNNVSAYEWDTTNGDTVWAANYNTTTTASTVYTLGHTTPIGGNQVTAAIEVQADGGGPPPAADARPSMMGHWGEGP